MKYALVFQELSHLEGVVTCGHQIVIAKSLQEHVIYMCHEGLNSFYTQESGSQESISVWKEKLLVAYLINRESTPHNETL